MQNLKESLVVDLEKGKISKNIKRITYWIGVSLILLDILHKKLINAAFA